jgi:nitrous oxidase accessory protein NosD
VKNFTVIQKILVLGLLLALCASTFEGVKARQIADVPGPLQVMINNAPDGGTVNIPAGTYSETLLVDKNLTLIGASASLTILQPASTIQRVIFVTSGHNLTLEHLRVTCRVAV